MVYQEILAIRNTFRKSSRSTLGARESRLHHELDVNYAKVFNVQVTNITNFLIARGNPYLSENQTQLRNIISSVRASEAATQQLKEFYNNSIESFLSFRNERFVEKSSGLSDPIKKINLQQLSPDVKEKVPRQSSDIHVKDLSYLQRNVDVARRKGISLSQVMEHDLLSTNILFDGDYASKLEDKSVLVRELEKHFESQELNFENKTDLQTVLLVDFMSMTRRMSLSELAVFEELLTATWKKVKSICQFPELHWIFDSCIDNSIKEGERKQELAGQPLELVVIQEDMSIPVQRHRFWSSSSNKEKVQDLCQSSFTRLAIETGIQLVLRGYVSCEDKIIDCTGISTDRKIVIVPELNSKIEDADQKLIPHIHYSISQGAKRSVVISNDTDVFALLIHYLLDFLGLGLQELWIMFGVGDKTLFLLLHLLLYKIGVPKCKVIYKAHILNGSDSTSKIGSKKSPINANSELHLQQFGEENELSVETAERAEQYLIKVEQPKSTYVTDSICIGRERHHMLNCHHSVIHCRDIYNVASSLSG